MAAIARAFSASVSVAARVATPFARSVECPRLPPPVSALSAAAAAQCPPNLAPPRPRIRTSAALHLKAPRAFSVAAISRRDIIQEMYLNEIRNYKPPKDAGSAAAASLVSSFATPVAPPAPQLELAQSDIVEEAADAEAEWPALKNIVDDTHTYNDEWEFHADGNDGGALLPKRLKEVDYLHDH
ncbi:hypothetical protein HDU83_002248 [Entophlyctis luteolus]|nr:hypothetical protein HDU82_003063 [Entophlyctis luteolus]KAJ3355963.1 hypothetical protein HDU83_002248 [Entophlyctis luteolus]